MAFYATGDQQVRLRFNRYTEEVLKNDMSLFGETKENTFINKIVQNYYQNTRASIHTRLVEYQNTLEESLPPNPSSCFQENIYYKDSLALYIKTLIEEYAHEPYIIREQIYFKKILDTIAEAITTKKQLLITISRFSRNQNRFLIYRTL